MEGRKFKRTLRRGKVIQDRLKLDGSPNDIVKISKKFKFRMQKGNVIGALKILTNNMSGGMLSLKH